MKRITKRMLVVLGAAVAAVSLAVGAYAYWTTSGSGTGSASTGTNTAVTVTQVGTVSALVPGGAAQAVDFKINNSVSTPQYVTSVAVAITGVTGPNITASFPCSASDFTLVQPNAINQDLAAGDTTFSPSGSTLKLDNTTSNQDGCKGATVALSFTAS